MSTAPLPGSWAKQDKGPKKPFVLQEHLTTRPLKRSPELLALRNQLKKGKKK